MSKSKQLSKFKTFDDLPLQQMGYYEDADGNMMSLFMSEGDYVVSVCDEGGKVRAIQRLGTKREAWKMFVEQIKQDVGIVTQTP